MKFKLIAAFLPDDRLDDVLNAVRAAGATGSTVIPSARGEGLEPARKLLGLDVSSHRNLVLWLVETDAAPAILARISAVGRFEDVRGAGIACQIDVDDTVGLLRQIAALDVARRAR